MDNSSLDQDRLNQIIGRNVKFYRELYNINKGKLTQAKLAELVDVSTSLIGGLESEGVNQGISNLTLFKISKVLEVPIQKFFETPYIETVSQDFSNEF
mgnify:CR=1 FL=1